MLANPGDTANTVPPEFTVAMEVLPLDQTPPGVALLTDAVARGQALLVPVMFPAFGRGFTIMGFWVVAVPQELVVVYTNVSRPGDTPEISVPESEARPLVRESVPPVPVTLSGTVVQTHKSAVGVIVPALGTGNTETG